jgi:dihydroxyacetone kinase-like protein
MRTLAAADFAKMLRAAAENVIANEPILTKADQAIGDGDHGIGMARGFGAALLALDQQEGEQSPGKVFAVFGTAILSNAGGASGAVFGTFFRGVGKALTSELVDLKALAAAFDQGAKAVMARGNAKPGDKTMLDALAPAVDGINHAQTEAPAKAFRIAAAAARTGAEATSNMIAGTGRAKMLGQRSIGFIDPGALTMTLVFEGMASCLNKLGPSEFATPNHDANS